MGRKRISSATGKAALLAESFDEATAVRFLLQELEAASPGGTVEIRVPPYGAVQCIGGLDHRRGTPPNVAEMDPQTLIGLCNGSLDLSNEVLSGKVFLSGSRAGEISELFPALIRE